MYVICQHIWYDVFDHVRLYRCSLWICYICGCVPKSAWLCFMDVYMFVVTRKCNVFNNFIQYMWQLQTLTKNTKEMPGICHFIFIVKTNIYPRLWVAAGLQNVNHFKHTRMNIRACVFAWVCRRIHMLSSNLYYTEAHNFPAVKYIHECIELAWSSTAMFNICNRKAWRKLKF